MQAYSPVLPVGEQRYYRHAWDAFSTIVREEGMKGLLRGWDAAILRGAIGGSVRVAVLHMRVCVYLTSPRFAAFAGTTPELHLEQESARPLWDRRSGQHVDVPREQLDRGCSSRTSSRV